MAQKPKDEIHALQIQAGILGRKAGHVFEDTITDEINKSSYPISFEKELNTHVNTGNPAFLLLHYIASTFNRTKIIKAVAFSTGALATSEEGKTWLVVNGLGIKKCKSDLIINIQFDLLEVTVGVSIKQCNNNCPTNAQLFFTTARSFSKLLINNGISVSESAIKAMRQFCGDKDFRPLDNPELIVTRLIDPRRFFWEEVDELGRLEWQTIFSTYQADITKLLLQKAYLNDSFSPDFLLHKTKKSINWNTTEIALYSIDEILQHSNNYSSFHLKSYTVKKGSYKDPQGITHSAPRFGIIQMQRGGQAQHPEQLQFNLEAGYFYKINQTRST